MSGSGKVKVHKSLSQKQRETEIETAGRQQLAQLILQTRVHAVAKVLDALFQADPTGASNTYRLKGLGGPTGTITQDFLNTVIHEVVTEGMEEIPNGEVGGEVPEAGGVREGDAPVEAVSVLRDSPNLEG